MLQSFNTLRCAAALLATTILPLATHAQVLEYVGSASDSIVTNTLQNSPHITADGEHLYVGDNGGMIHYSRNNTTGELTFITKYSRDTANSFFPAGSPVTTRNGAFLYSPASVLSTITVLSRNTSTGTVTLLQNYSNGQNNVDGLSGAVSICLSPNEKNVYVGAFDDDAVTVFDRDTTTGLLTFRETFKNNVNGVTGLNSCRLVKVSPNGQFVYAVGFDDDAVVTFSRDATTGALTFVNAFTIPYTYAATPTSFDISNNGDFVVVSNNGDSSVHILSINQTTGVPSLFQTLREGSNGLSNVLGYATLNVRFSPDFTYLYIASINTAPTRGKLSIFIRNTTNNTFSLIEDKTLGTNTTYRQGAVISADSRFIYNMQQTPNSIAIHQDTTTRIIVAIEQLGIQQENSITNVYPNPSKGAVYFDCPSINDGTALRLRLVDVLGRELYNRELVVSGGRLEADFSALPRGAYYVQLGNKTVALRLD